MVVIHLSWCCVPRRPASCPVCSAHNPLLILREDAAVLCTALTARPGGETSSWIPDPRSPLPAPVCLLGPFWSWAAEQNGCHLLQETRAHPTPSCFLRCQVFDDIVYSPDGSVDVSLLSFFCFHAGDVSKASRRWSVCSSAELQFRTPGFRSSNAVCFWGACLKIQNADRRYSACL